MTGLKRKRQADDAPPAMVRSSIVHTMKAEAQLDSVYAKLNGAEAQEQHAKNQRGVSDQLSKLLGEIGQAWAKPDLDRVASYLKMEPDAVVAAWKQGQERQIAAAGGTAQGGAQAADFRDLVALALPKVLADAGFDPSIYQPRNESIGGYGRYLLHSESEPANPFCLQMFAFLPRQKTPIHDHPNECASFIAQGELAERLYSPPTGHMSPSGLQVVEKEHKNPREAGSFAGFGPTELGIPHSLKNKSDNVAVSVHLYRDMDGITEGARVAAKSVFERTPKTAVASLTGTAGTGPA